MFIQLPSHEKLELLIDGHLILEPIIPVFTMDARLQLANKAYVAIFPYSEGSLHGQTVFREFQRPRSTSRDLNTR
jgi:hypothetical protein